MRLQRVNSIEMKFFVTTVCGEPNKTKISLVSDEKKTIIINCSLQETVERWSRWINGIQFIQVAFNNLNPDEREFLISGTTPEEWNKLFPEE